MTESLGTVITLADIRASGWSLDTCPVRSVLAQVAGKWPLLILCALHERPHRFGSLRREISDISQRMLTMTLRELQRQGLVTRTVFPTVPPSVEYAATDLGRSLYASALPLIHWAVSNHLARQAACERFDKEVSRDIAVG